MRSKKVKKALIPPPRKKWSLPECQTAMEAFHAKGGANEAEAVFEAWAAAGLCDRKDFPGRWYVLRMVRRASQRLNSKEG